MKNDFLHAYCLGFDWSGWIALIKSKILITKQMSWPGSSDKWKAPEDSYTPCREVMDPTTYVILWM